MLLLFIFIALMGCISYEADITQEFSEEGNSILEAEYVIAIDYSSLEGFGGNSQYERIFYSDVLEFYNSKEFAEALCKASSASCEVVGSNKIKVTQEFEPGGLYYFEKEFDALNLEETLTYEIIKVPLIDYFVDYEKFNIKEELSSYLRKKYPSLNYVCRNTFLSDFICVDLREQGNSFVFELEKETFFEGEVLGYACSEEEVFFPEDLDYSPTSKNQVTFVCPKNTKALVIKTESEGFLTKEKEVDYSIIEVVPFEELLEEVVGKELDYDVSEVTSLYWDLERGKVGNLRYSDLFSSSLPFANPVKIEVTYTAIFPGEVYSAEIDGVKLKPKENKLIINLEDIAEREAKGPLQVVVKKQISPLGIFTWIVLAIALGGIYFFFIKKP